MNIAKADLIARAEFKSVDSIIWERDSWGYMVDMVYSFEVVEYLKGSGADEVNVRMGGDPKFLSFPDYYGNRTMEEAIQLAERWTVSSSDLFAAIPKGILLLTGPDGEGEYRFVSDTFTERDDFPIVGETWMVEDSPWYYRVRTESGEAALLPLDELKVGIQHLAALMVGDKGPCAQDALRERTRVREQIAGVLQIMTLAGYRDPRPFPRYTVEFDSGESADSIVMRDNNPPFVTPLFGHYWLDGRDTDLFTVYSWLYDNGAVAGISANRPLPQGEYSVHYSQYHHSLPCSSRWPAPYGGWWDGDTTEWTINVTAPPGTLHEAFFDPVFATSTLMYWADAQNGVLDPAAISIEDGRMTTIKSISWKDHQVTLALSPLPLPPEHNLDFIDMDGRIALRLAVDYAEASVNGDTHTLTWHVCHLPWQAGDKLMLRIQHQDMDDYAYGPPPTSSREACP